MATSSTSKYARPTAFIVRRVVGKATAAHIRPAKAAGRRSEQMQMTKAETEAFFAACEAQIKAEIDIFAHLPEVTKWFKE